MTKFKVGDIVTKVNEDTLLTIVEADEESGQDTYTLDYGTHHSNHWWHNDELVLVKSKEKTMEDLQEGDILKNNSSSYDYEREVQGLVGKIVFTLDTDDGQARVDSVQKLKDTGWVLKGEEEEVTEVTLEEIAELKGISVDKLRIKE